MPRTWVADEDDAEQVTRLLVGFRDHHGRDWPPGESFARNVVKLIADPDTEFLLAARSEQAEALIQLRFRLGVWRDGPDCLVEDVFVDEAARGAGLGRELMEFAVTRARKRGARRMELDVSEENGPALALYRSLGFSERYSEESPRDLYMRVHLD